MFNHDQKIIDILQFVWEPFYFAGYVENVLEYTCIMCVVDDMCVLCVRCEVSFDLCPVSLLKEFML